MKTEIDLLKEQVRHVEDMLGEHGDTHTFIAKDKTNTYPSVVFVTNDPDPVNLLEELLSVVKTVEPEIKEMTGTVISGAYAEGSITFDEGEMTHEFH